MNGQMAPVAWMGGDEFTLGDGSGGPPTSSGPVVVGGPFAEPQCPVAGVWCNFQGQVGGAGG